MNFAIILRGAAAVGKTTIANEIAKQINAKVISFDKVMKDLGLDYVSGDKWIPEEKFMKANKEKLPEFKESLKDQTVIFEHNFYHLNHLKDLIENLDCKNQVFTLKADVNKCIERDNTRDKNLGKDAVSDVFKLTSAFDFGTCIDTTNKSVKNVADEIISSFLS